MDIKVRIGNYLSEKFEVRLGIKQEDPLSPVLFSLALEHVIKEVMRTKKGLNLGGITPMLGYDDDLILLSEDKETINLNTTTLMKAGKELGLKINTDMTKYMVSYKNGDNSGYIDIESNIFEYAEKFRYLGSTITKIKKL